MADKADISELSKKRNIQQLRAGQLEYKFKSKRALYQYLNI